MKYFTKTKHDIEEYMKNIQKLENILNPDTHNFMLNDSFHDSVLNKLTVLNNSNIEETPNSDINEVSVVAKLTYWNDRKYELLWENVNLYSVDFDITRNRIVETNQILYERGLDQWSHDELTLTADGNLRHEIFLFSQTTIIIESTNFIIKAI